MIKRIVSWLTGAALGLTLLLPLQGQAQTAKPFSNEQLEQMTAPVALFPDALLAQLFMATTYPEDFAAAAAWSKAHPNDKGDAAVKMVENQPWDPSVASLVAFPDVLITFGAQPEWVRNMGDAFLAQPEDVMNAVQRLRQRAQQAGNLKSNEQVTVSTQPAAPAPTTVVVQQSAPPPQVIVIEPAQPSTVFVPAYNPMYVFGPWPYPAYAPFFFPPPPGYWFSRTIATGIAWGIGIGISNALWGGVNWGRGSVNINVNRYNNINVNRQINANGNRANWNQNPERRGATPYRGGDATRQVELPGGCVCCVLGDDLDRTLLELIASNPGLEAIVLETTGVADPLPIAWAMNVSASLVDLSSLSTVGALFIAGAGSAASRSLFNGLLIWGLAMSVVGAALCFVLFG